MSLFGKSNSAIGLDIGSSSVRAVEIGFSEGKRVLTRIGEIGLAPGIVSEGEVHDSEALSTALTSLWRLGGFKTRRVFLGLANQKVIVRHIQLPFMSDEDLKGAINYEAQEYIPIPLEEAILDYQVLREFDEDNQRMLEILVVAAQKNMIDSFVRALTAAKLSPIAIDVQSFALLRSVLTTPNLFASEGGGEEQPREAICLLDMSAGITNLIVASDDEPLFTRFIPLGGDYFTTSLSDYMGVSFEVAEDMKIEFGLPLLSKETTVVTTPAAETTIISDGESESKTNEGEADIEEVTQVDRGDDDLSVNIPQDEAVEEDPTAEKSEENHETEVIQIDDDQKSEQVSEILLKCTGNFIDELRRSLDYFLSQPNAKPIGKIVLTGGASMMKNLSEYIAQAYRIPVEFGFPLQKIDINKTKMEDDELVEMEPRLAIAIGLALYEEEL